MRPKYKITNSISVVLWLWSEFTPQPHHNGNRISNFEFRRMCIVLEVWR